MPTTFYQVGTAILWCAWAMLSAFPMSAQSPPELVLQAGHQNGVNALAFSPDGQVLASGGNDGTIILWGVKTGRVLRRLRGPLESVENLTFSPDGKWLASSAGQRIVGLGRSYKYAVLWDVQNGSVAHILTGAIGPVAFVNTGHAVVSVNERHVLATWDTSSGEVTHELADCKYRTTMSLLSSPDGRWLASECQEGSIEIRKMPEGKVIRTFQESTLKVHSARFLAFSADGTQVVLPMENGRIDIQRVDTGQSSLVLTGTASIVAMSDDNHRLATIENDIVSVFHLTSDAQQNEPRLETHESLSSHLSVVAFSPDIRLVATADPSDGEIVIWDVFQAKIVQILERGEYGTKALVTSPDGITFAAGGFDNTLVVWSVLESGPAHTIRGFPHGIYNLAYSPDGRILAASTGSVENLFFGDRTLSAWDASTGKLIWKSEADHMEFGHLAFSRDGRWLASIARPGDGDALILDATNGKTIHTIATGGGAQALAFSPDGRSLALGETNKKIEILDLATLTPVKTFWNQSDLVMSVTFSPDSRLVAAADLENVNVWKVGDGTQLCTLRGHTDFVSSLSFSQDGSRLISASWDHTIKIWDLETCHPVADLTQHNDRVNAIAFLPDGRRFLSASDDGTVRLWNSETYSPLATFISVDGGTDWLVVTSEGLFDGTAGAMRKVAWRLRQSTNIVGLERFFNDYYYPGLYSALWSGKILPPRVDVSSLLGLSGLSLMIRQSLASIKKTETGSSYLCVNSRTAGRMAHVKSLTEETESSRVTLIVRKGGDVDLLPVYLKNAPQVQDPDCEYGFLLTKGIQGAVLPFNQDLMNQPTSTLAEERQYITEMQAQAGRGKHPPKGQTHLLAIGIEHYSSSDLWKLPHTIPDVEKVASIFKGSVTLTDPKLYEIRRAFFELRIKANPDDTVIVFLSGHGVVNSEEFIFLPRDAQFDSEFQERYSLDPNQQPSKGRWLNVISAADLADLIRQLRARKVLLIVDACQAGGALEPLERVAEAKISSELRRIILTHERSQDLPEIGIGIIGASDPLEYSFSQPEDYSPLVKTLLEAFGKAPRPSANSAGRQGKAEKIQIQELIEYIRRRLPDISRESVNRTQIPVAIARGANFPLE